MIQKLIPYGVAVLIAAGSFFTGAVTDVGQATKIVFDKDAAKAQCAQLLEGTSSAVTPTPVTE